MLSEGQAEEVAKDAEAIQSAHSSRKSSVKEEVCFMIVCPVDELVKNICLLKK